MYVYVYVYVYIYVWGGPNARMREFEGGRTNGMEQQDKKGTRRREKRTTQRKKREKGTGRHSRRAFEHIMRLQSASFHSFSFSRLFFHLSRLIPRMFSSLCWKFARPTRTPVPPPPQSPAHNHHRHSHCSLCHHYIDMLSSHMIFRRPFACTAALTCIRRYTTLHICSRESRAAGRARERAMAMAMAAPLQIQADTRYGNKHIKHTHSRQMTTEGEKNKKKSEEGEKKEAQTEKAAPMMRSAPVASSSASSSSSSRGSGSHSSSSSSSSRSSRNSQTLQYVIGIAVLALGASWAAIPLYRAFCAHTGYGGTTQTDKDGSKLATMSPSKKEIVVYFNADVSPSMHWKFVPSQTQMRVRMGEPVLAFYKATNLRDKAITGVATYNVTPMKAGLYFHKIQCFW